LVAFLFEDPHGYSRRASTFDRLPTRRRDPDTHHLDRLAVNHRHLALCYSKLALNEPGQQVAFEAMNVDERAR
jgi:hypothetical protein